MRAETQLSGEFSILPGGQDFHLWCQFLDWIAAPKDWVKIALI